MRTGVPRPSRSGANSGEPRCQFWQLTLSSRRLPIQQEMLRIFGLSKRGPVVHLPLARLLEKLREALALRDNLVVSVSLPRAATEAFLPYTSFVVTLAILFGGGGNQGWSDALVQLAALPLLAWALFKLSSFAIGSLWSMGPRPAMCDPGMAAAAIDSHASIVMESSPGPRSNWISL